ncbi:Gfo/Idh/MocA family oxidoreductase [Mesobacillus subterraneus]|uniref:Gfo/Idh/MocA family protein n=1 Tax=Mesobacillus subterraneus TaxID=285983 RepID=UPI00203C13B6|nr:Gfo/Idh/MocA family oxidoreductase [Mesobacillus subterraneus]MCM3665808.1 Gfo/Idh/MocA family oxidoreductase [Mesobacillus subterraneus]MCM3684800.1 Gfo/Idh/MocA family oxidoreductase [Mesobacillus subterraneus]
MGNKVNIGVIGASWFADLWYLPVLNEHPDAVIKAICSKNGESARRMAEKYSIKESYSSYKKMIDDAELDGVCIITPNDSHKDISLYAIEKGLHVMCEKPMSLNGEEAKVMVAAARDKGITAGVNFTYRENPGVQKTREFLREVKLGTVLEGSFEYSGDYGLNGPPGWRGQRDTGGIGGILQDLGSHLIDLAQEVVDDQLVEVMAMANFLKRDSTPELTEFAEGNQAADSVVFIGKFSSGFHSVFRTSWIAIQGNKGQTIEIKLHGSKGSIHLIAAELGISLFFAEKGKGWEEIQLGKGTDSFQLSSKAEERKFRPWRISTRNEVWKWLDHITGKSESRIASFEEGYQVQQVIDAIMDSAAKGRRIVIK